MTPALLVHRNVCLDKRPECVSGNKDNMVIFCKTRNKGIMVKHVMKMGR